MSDLYNRIHGLCEELQISDAEACKAVQMPRSTLSNLKNGHAKKLGAEKLNSFSLFFSRELGRKITVEYLLGEPGEDSGDDLAPDDLYNRIHSLVLDKGMTDGSACAAVGLPRSTLGSLKTGKTKSLSQKNLKLFADHIQPLTISPPAFRLHSMMAQKMKNCPMILKTWQPRSLWQCGNKKSPSSQCRPS